MRPLLLTAALVVLATPAMADPSPSERAGLRYLSWPGKAEQTAPQAQTHGARLRPPMRPSEAPAQANRYSAADPYAPSGVYDPPAPPPTPMAAAPMTQAASRPIASMALAPVAPEPPVASEPAAQPASAPPPAPVYAAPTESAAPIQSAALAPAENRPRVYSLHRAYGEQPDHTDIPAPVYLDALPIDLAAPPPQEPARDKNGKPVHSDHGDPDRVEP